MPNLHEHHWSQLKLARLCPLAYATRRHDYAGEPALRGIVGHEILQLYDDKLASEGRHSDTDLMETLINDAAGTHGLGGDEWDYLKGALRKHAEKHVHAVPSGWDHHTEHAMRVVIDRVGDRYEVHEADADEIPSDDPFYTDPVLYAGRLDRSLSAGEAALVEDYKTDRAITPASEAKHDDQLRAYAVLAAGCLGAKSVKVRVIYVAHAYSFDFDMDEDDIQQAAAFIHGLAKRAEQADQMGGPPTVVDVEPRPCSHCRYCHHAKVCPAAVALSLGDEAWPSSKWPVLKAIAATVQKRVKAECKDEPVPLGDGELLGFVPKSRAILRPDWVECLFRAAHLTRDDGAELSLLRETASMGKGGINGTAVKKWIWEFLPKEKQSDVIGECFDTRKHTELGIFSKVTD